MPLSLVLRMAPTYAKSLRREILEKCSLFPDYIGIQLKYASVKNFSCRFCGSLEMVAQRLRTGSAYLTGVLLPGSKQNQQKTLLAILAVYPVYPVKSAFALSTGVQFRRTIYPGFSNKVTRRQRSPIPHGYRRHSLRWMGRRLDWVVKWTQEMIRPPLRIIGDNFA